MNEKKNILVLPQQVMEAAEALAARTDPAYPRLILRQLFQEAGGSEGLRASAAEVDDLLRAHLPPDLAAKYTALSEKAKLATSKGRIPVSDPGYARDYSELLEDPRYKETLDRIAPGNPGAIKRKNDPADNLG